jgi:hypothetical protein
MPLEKDVLEIRVHWLHLAGCLFGECHVLCVLPYIFRLINVFPLENKLMWNSMLTFEERK